jgi:hypothetical protein
MPSPSRQSPANILQGQRRPQTLQTYLKLKGVKSSTIIVITMSANSKGLFTADLD